MRADYSYGREKLGQAVDALEGQGVPGLTSDTPIKQRLFHAYMTGLHVIRPEQHLPSEVRADFADLLRDLTWIPAEGQEGTATRTIREMSEEEAVALADRIVALYARVAEITGRAKPERG